jgi:hypothetical protein
MSSGSLVQTKLRVVLVTKATCASTMSPYGTPQAAVVLTARAERLRDFSQEGQKIRRFDGSPRRSALNKAPDRRRQRERQVSPSVLLIFL